MSYHIEDEYQGEKRASNEEIVAQKEMILKQILDSQARTRLGNIRMVKPEVASTIENYLITTASQGRLPSRISDDQLKQILLSMQKPKRNFKINRL